MSHPKKTHDIPMRIIIGWGVGTLPMAIYFNSFNILALRFLTDVVGLTAAIAGALIGLSKVYDAVSDPLMGTISDRTKSRLGRRHPYILLGGLMCAISIYALFSIPDDLTQNWAVIYTAIALLVYATSYTVYNIPYLTMPSEITTQSTTRSLMISWRVAAIGLGGLIAGAVGPKIIAAAGGGAPGHSVMGLCLGIAILFFALATFFSTYGAPDYGQTTKREKVSFRQSVQTVLDNKPFLQLLGLKFFLLTGVAISSATLAFFIVWILGRGYQDLGTVVLFTTAGQILGTPIWLNISRKIGKRNAFFLSGLLFSMVSLTWLIADANEALWLTLTRVFVKGLGTGGILLVGQVLLPDAIEYDRLRTGQRREGVLSGVYTTIEKLSFAFGTMVTGLYLSAMGYVSKLRPGDAVQSDSAIMAINYCQSILPALCIGVSAIFMWLYRLDEEKLVSMRASAA